MDLSQLEVLVAIAEERGFSRAAGRLNKTQPAISQAIQKLESEIGSKLIDRSSKDGTLTDAGRILFDYAQQMLNLRRDARGAISDLGNFQRGKVAISANEYTVVCLMDVIAEYRSRYPQIRIEIRRSFGSQIPTEVLNRDVEMGVTSYRPKNPGLRSVTIATDELALIVAPDHPLATATETSIKQLGVESFLAHNVRSPYRERVIEAFEKNRTPLNIVCELPTLSAIKRLVERGVGVALMPKLAAENEIARGQVVALTVKEMRLERKIHLVYREGSQLSHAARAFLKSAKAAHAARTSG